MTEMRLSMVIDAVDRGAVALFGRVSQAVRGPATAARQAAGAVGQILDRAQSSYASLATAVGGGFAVREIMKDNDAYMRMGIAAGATGERIDSLRDSIYDTAVKGRVDLDELTAGFRAMRAGGIGLDDAQNDLESLAQTIQRLGGQGDAIGSTFAVLQRFAGLKKPSEFIDAISILRSQMKGVDGGLEDFMSAAAPLLSTYTGQGHTGLSAVRDVGALYASVRPGVAMPRQALSAVQSVLEMMSDRDRAMQLESLGIDVFGHSQAEKLAGYNSTTRLPIGDVLQQIMQRYQEPGMAPLLDSVVGTANLRALKVPMAEVAQTGKSQTLESKLGISPDTPKFMDEVSRSSRTFGASLSGLRGAILKVGDQTLSKPLGVFAEMLADNSSVAAWGVSVLAGGAALGVVGGWLKFVKFGFVELLPAIRTSTMLIGDFVLAMRAGYGILTSLSLAAAASPISAVIAMGAALAGLVLLTDHYSSDIIRMLDHVANKFDGINHALPDWAKQGNGAPSGLDAGYDAMGNAVTPSLPPLPTPQKDSKKVDGEIVVRFENLPPGVTVEQKSGSTGIDWMLDLGYSMGAY